jgi:hypothetical protein
MVFAAVLIDASHPAFEDTEIPLDRVCRHVATSIFAFRMIDALMFGEFLAGLLVMLRFIGMQPAIENDIVEQHIVDGFGVEVFHLERFRAAAALDQSYDLAFCRVPRLSCQPLPLTKIDSGLPMNVSSTSTTLSFPPNGSGSGTNIASRIRCAMNQAV